MRNLKLHHLLTFTGENVSYMAPLKFTQLAKLGISQGCFMQISESGICCVLFHSADDAPMAVAYRDEVDKNKYF